MPFEITPEFKPVVPTFPIEPLTPARKACLRLAGLIREGCAEIPERASHVGCAIGAAYFAHVGVVFNPTSHDNFNSYELAIACAIGLDPRLIKAVSEWHFDYYCCESHRANYTDGRLAIAAALERGEFDRYVTAA